MLEKYFTDSSYIISIENLSISETVNNFTTIE